MICSSVKSKVVRYRLSLCPEQTNHFGLGSEPPCCRGADAESVAFVVLAPPKTGPKCCGQMRDPASQPKVAIKVRPPAKLTA